MELNKKLIGIRIMQKRKALGYTQEELSEMINYSKNHISSVERGVCVPTTQFIFRLCSLLGETPDYYLIGKSNEKTNEMVRLIESLPEGSQDVACKLIETYIENSHKL